MIYNLGSEHSTDYTLLDMTQQIKEAIDSGNLIVGVFVGFQKAFYTINHKILLKKLEHYGVRGLVYQWFSSYMSNRQQYVSITVSI